MKEDRADKKIAQTNESLLVGTSWKAVEISFHANSMSNATQLDGILPDHPITLSFDLGRISGSSGCNHHHGPATLSPTKNTL